MKNVILITLVFILALSINNCKEKEDENAPFSVLVTGIILDSCDGDPQKNLGVKFYSNFIPARDIFHDPTPEKLLAETITDDNGRFGIRFEDENSSNSYSIRYEKEFNTLMLATGTLSFNSKDMAIDVGTVFTDGFVKNTHTKFFHVTNFKSDKVIISNTNTGDLKSDTIFVNPPGQKSAFETLVPMRYNIKNIGEGDAKFFASYLVKWMDGNKVYQTQNEWITTKVACSNAVDSIVIKRVN